MVVRMRSTRSKRNNRRGQQSVSLKPLVVEQGVERRRHFASKETGIYRSRQAFSVDRAKRRLEKKTHEEPTDEKKTTDEVVEAPKV